MSGKAAAFGGRMMNAVADQVLKQFAENFAAAGADRSQRSAASFGRARRRHRGPPAARQSRARAAVAARRRNRAPPAGTRTASR